MSSDSGPRTIQVGARMELVWMDRTELNGRHVIVMGPVCQDRVTVLMVGLLGNNEIRVMPRNLSAHFSNITHSGMLRNGPRGGSQSSHARYDKHRPYVVKREDFEKVPRWPNDGMQQSVEAFARGDDQNIAHQGICAKQAAYIRVMGGWPAGDRLKDMPPEGRGLLLSIPSSVQSKAAHVTFDPELAILNLFERESLPAVSALLQHSIGSPSLGCSREEFPGLRVLLAALARRGLATDANLELLFGDAAHVRALMLEVGAWLAAPPPRGSSMHPQVVDILSHKWADAVRACAQCGRSGTEAGTVLKGCSGCSGPGSGSRRHKTWFCGERCERTGQDRHRAACLRAQGKEVCAEAQAESEAALKLRASVVEAAVAEQRGLIEADRARQQRAAIAEFEAEDWSPQRRFDCRGSAHTQSIGGGYCAFELVQHCAARVHALDAARTEQLTPATPIRGLTDALASDVWTLFVLWTRAGALVLLPYTNLYVADGDDPGPAAGVHITGAFVAKGAPRDETEEIEWEAVPYPPRSSASSGQWNGTSACAWLGRWLETAAARATAPTHGIYSCGSAGVPGHEVAMAHSGGMQFRVVGPRTCSKPVQGARVRGVARRQLAKASAALGSGDARRAAAQTLSALQLLAHLERAERSWELVARGATLLADCAAAQPALAPMARARLQHLLLALDHDELDTSAPEAPGCRIRSALALVLALPRLSPEDSAAAAEAAADKAVKGGGEKRRCKDCGVDQAKGMFSASQWKKAPRRCTKCVDASGEGAAGAAGASGSALVERAEKEAVGAVAVGMDAEMESAQAELEKPEEVWGADSECNVCYQELDRRHRYYMPCCVAYSMCASCLEDMVEKGRRLGKSEAKCYFCPTGKHLLDAIAAAALLVKP